METGEMHGLAIVADIAELVGGHMPVPTRIHRNACALRDVAVRRNPGGDMIRRHLHVGVLLGFGGNVDHHEGADQIFYR